MTTTQRKSRILDEMLETAQGLHGAGLISKRRMGELDALGKRPIPEAPQPDRTQRVGGGVVTEISKKN